MFDTMRSLKEELESLKADNDKHLRAKYEQEELNELLLIILMDKIGEKHNRQNYWSSHKKIHVKAENYEDESLNAKLSW